VLTGILCFVFFVYNFILCCCYAVLQKVLVSHVCFLIYTILWLVGSVGSTVVESDEQILVSMPDDGHMALYEVCCYHFFSSHHITWRIQKQASKGLCF